MGFYPLTPLFDLGEILVSPAVIQMNVNYGPLVRRHQHGDWGDICQEHIEDNNHALAHHEDILSQYPVTQDGRSEILVIMTENDRSITVIFLLGEPELADEG